MNGQRRGQPSTRNRRFDGISEQVGDGHGTNTAWHRGNVTRTINRFGESYVSYKFRTARRVYRAVDTDIDYNCAGFEPVTPNEFRGACGRDDNIRLSTKVWQVSSLELRACDCASGIAKQKCQRLSNDVRTTDDNHIESRQIAYGRFDEMNNPQRGARGKRGLPYRQSSNVIGVKAIHILGGVDSFLDTPAIDVLR